MSDIGILHGPRLSQFKVPLGEKRRPCTWTLGARVQAPVVDAVEAIARKNGCSVGDVLRTALSAFLENHPLAAEANNGQPLTAHQSGREAQINSGVLPRTHQRENRAVAYPSQPKSNLDTNQQSNLTSKPDQDIQTKIPTTKREGMKDKIPSF